MSAMATDVADVVTLIAGPCSNEPPPPPIPPPRKPWNCVQCARVKTPVKRSGPLGPGTLCNACGIRIRKAKQKVAKAGAAAAAAAEAAAAGAIPPIRRQRQKKRPPPKKKTVRPNKSHHLTVPIKKHRGRNLGKPHPNTLPPAPPTPAPPPVSSSVTALPNHHMPSTSPVSARVPTGIVVPLTSAPQPPSTTRPCPSPSAPAPTVVTSIPPSSPIGVLSPATGILLSATVASAAVSSPSQLHPPLRVPPTTPEDVHLIQSDPPPHDPMTSLLRQSSQTEESNPEQLLNTLDIGNIRINDASSDSVNRTDKDTFPGSIFAQGDPTATTSSQIQVLDVFDGLPEHSDTFPPTTSTVSVEGPYGEEATMPVPGGLVVTEMSDAASTVWATVANPPIPMTTQSPLSVSPGVVSPYDEAFYEHELKKMDFLQAQICENMSTIDVDIANRATRHEQLTVERNEIFLAISDLLNAKEIHRKRQQVVSENRARVTCMLQYLRKPERRVVGNT